MDSNFSSSYGGTPGLGAESLAMGVTKNSSVHGVNYAVNSSVNSHISTQKPGSGEYCPIAQVPTVDSITNYESTAADVLSSAHACKPAKDAPISEWRDHLGVQLDLLLGKIVDDHLMVLPGHENRLMGGKYFNVLYLMSLECCRFKFLEYCRYSIFREYCIDDRLQRMQYYP